MISNPLLKPITKENIHLLVKRPDENAVYFTKIKSLFLNDVFKNFSIKILLKGQARYTTQMAVYSLNEKNNVLIAPRQQNGCVLIIDEQDTELLCIDINEQLIKQAVEKQLQYLKDPISADYSLSGIETVQSLTETAFYCQLQQLLQQNGAGYDKALKFDDEWYLLLAQTIVSTYFKEKPFSCIKQSTRVELIKRLNEGKQYIDRYYLHNPCIIDVARIALLSEFHFYRTFKELYKVTPYQYVLHKRLMHAFYLLERTELNICEIASICNFTDVFTFSKAFKRSFSMSPQKIRRYLYTSSDFQFSRT